MRSRAVRRAERYVGLALLAGVSSAAGAQQTQTGLLVSTGGSVETNPYNDPNVDGAAVAATAEIQPLLRVQDETTTIDLRGSAQFRQFFRRYGLEDSYGFNAGSTSRVSERLTLRTRGAFNYTDGSYGGFGRPGISPADPTVPLPELPPPGPTWGLTDVSLLGQRTRTTAFDFGTGADAQLTAYSRVSLDVDGRTMRFKNRGFGDYNNVSAEMNYSHRLSELTSVGLIGSVSRTDYRGAQAGDARVYSIMGSVERRLGANWNLSASGGMSFTKSAQTVGLPDINTSAFTARLRFCRQGEFSQFCVNANRSPEPTADGGVRVSNAISVDYSLRVAERDRLSLAGSFARTGAGRAAGMTLPAIEFVSASARYDRDISQKLTAFVSANLSKVFARPSRDANVGVNAGVQFRFGALQ